MDEQGAPGRHETVEERLDRNLLELLTELRVALPGVQVLFAFLLVVPFNQRWVELAPLGQRVYFVTLVATALSSVCLIAPSMHHRIQFRRQEKEYIVRVANTLAIVGLTFLAVAMTGVVLLVTDFLFDSTTTVLATGGLVVAFLVVWFAIPLRRRLAR